MKYKITEYTTKRGSKGLIISVPEAPVVSMRFNLRAGYRYVDEYDSKTQIPHVMEHIIAGATEDYPDQVEYETVFKKNGAYKNASTNPVALNLVCDCADFEWERIIDLIRGAVCHPSFEQKYFDSELGNVRSELTGRLSQPARMLSPKLSQEMGINDKTYPEMIESLSNISLEDVENYYKRTFKAENMRFCIAGDFTGKMTKIKSELDKFDLPTGGERLPLPKDKPHSAPALVIERQDVPAINFDMRMEILREYDDAEDDAMDILDHILNGGFSSRIFGKARQKGLLYGCGSYTSSGIDFTEWAFGGQANNDKLPAVFDLIVEELERIKAGDISEREIDDAKSYALGRYRMGIQTAGQLLNFLQGRYFYDGKIRNYEETPERINSVTKEHMVELAREFFAKGIYGIGLYGTTDQAMGDLLHEKLSVLF